MQSLTLQEQRVPAKWKNILASPTMYHYARHIATGGLPFRQWTHEYGLTNSQERVADLGCGPADILRYLSPSRRPAFYLGIDISEEYLQAARQRAAAAGLEAQLLAMDLTLLPTDAAVQAQLTELLQEHRITRVLLLGVIHHIDDDSALKTLNLVHSVPNVQSMVTQDVVRLPGRRINNGYCDLDRGEHIRNEATYDALIARSAWPKHRKFWTSPKLPFLRYIHYELSK